MPDGLKISNQTGKLFYDSAWIAGVDYGNEASFEDAQDKDYEDQQACGDETNDEILGEEDYDEKTPDEIYEAEQLELYNNIQEDDPEPECNNENNIEMNLDEIQDEDEEPANETENAEAMLEVYSSTQNETDPNFRTTRARIYGKR
jgi:hypothetical protein